MTELTGGIRGRDDEVWAEFILLSHKLVIRDTNYQINQDYFVKSDSFFSWLIERKQLKIQDSSSSVTIAFDDSTFPDSQILFTAVFFGDLSLKIFRSFQKCALLRGRDRRWIVGSWGDCSSSRLSKCHRPDWIRFIQSRSQLHCYNTTSQTGFRARHWSWYPGFSPCSKSFFCKAKLTVFWLQLHIEQTDVIYSEMSNLSTNGT